jgi:hypothetical protein
VDNARRMAKLKELAPSLSMNLIVNTILDLSSSVYERNASLLLGRKR